MSSEFHKRASKLFQEARNESAIRRKTFVKEQAAGDVQLEKEVLSLLENDKEETILSRDLNAPAVGVIDPLGLDQLKAKSKQSQFSQVLFSTRGRTGLVFFILALIIGFFGILAGQKTKEKLAQIRGEETSAILNSNVQALEFWLQNYQANTEAVSNNKEVVEAIQNLIINPQNEAIAHVLDSLVNLYSGHLTKEEYILTDLTGNILLLSGRLLNGERVGERFGNEIYKVAGGTPQFILPFYANRDSSSLQKSALVWMQVPVFDKEQKVIATFGIGSKAERTFTKILRTARMGESGETYAINREGWFISESRYEDEMRNDGMMDSDTSVSSILNLAARMRIDNARQEVAPHTELARMIVASSDNEISEEQGVSTIPSEDYKGKNVIGSWLWIPKYQFGVITQIDAEEAFAPARYLYVLIALAVLIMLLAAAYSFFNANQLVKVKSALSQAAQFGQYELIKPIAEGGMGTVFFARHKLLKRPTAIKVIRADKNDENMAQRFGREVKLASQLSHPNTIEIFDYGFTQTGQPFYAMEYVQGVSLWDVVRSNGPMDPARIIYVLRQVCGSLFEAHTLGMVHRDIKPQNIMLSNKIGLHDFVKVLDFGLAKPFVETGDLEETRAITGTPVYIAPERIKRPGLAEPSADIYAVGALGYYLLAGYPIFDYSSDLDLLYSVLNETPKELPKELPEQLCKLIMFCLEKEPENRPTSIEELKLFLDNMSADFPWTKEQAEEWWKKHRA